jgi:hypothetical protein
MSVVRSPSQDHWWRPLGRSLATLLGLGLIVGLSGARLGCEGQKEKPPERGQVTSTLSKKGVVVRTASSSELQTADDAPKGKLTRCNSKEPLQVLFVGNSYTFYYDMPRLVTQIAGSAGCKLDISWATNGGYQLSLHAQDPTTIDAIHEKPWDVVVLQNQSQEPAFLPEEVRERSLPAVEALAGEIYATHPKAQILFYSTWGRRAGDKANCKYNPSVCTFDGHTEAVEAGYSVYAEAVGGDLVRAGRAFQFVERDEAAAVAFADLYDRDGSHPSLFGSYLTAAVFFYQLTGVSPEGQAFPSALLPEEAAYLQQIAAMTIEGEPLEQPGASVVTEESLVARCPAGACEQPTTDHMEGAATRVVLFEGTCSDWYIRSDVTQVASMVTSLECRKGACSTDSIDTWTTRTGAAIPPGTYSVFVTIDADLSGSQSAEDYEACEDSAFSVGDGRIVTIDRFYPASSLG